MATNNRHPGLLQRMVNYIPKTAPKWAEDFAKRQDELNRYLWFAAQDSSRGTVVKTTILGNTFDPVTDPFLLAVHG